MANTTLGQHFAISTRQNALNRGLTGTHSTTSPIRTDVVSMQPMSQEQLRSLKSQINSLVASVNGLNPNIMIGIINKMNISNKEEYVQNINSFFSDLKKRVTDYGNICLKLGFANQHTAYVSPHQLNDVNVLVPLNNLYMLIGKLNTTGQLNQSRDNLTKFVFSKIEKINNFIKSIITPSAPAKTATTVLLKKLLKVASKIEKKYHLL